MYVETPVSTHALDENQTYARNSSFDELTEQQQETYLKSKESMYVETPVSTHAWMKTRRMRETGVSRYI